MSNNPNHSKSDTGPSLSDQGVRILKPFALPSSAKSKDRAPDENPFLNRVMILNRDDFYGRKSVIRKLFAKINTTRPQSVSIIGDRKIGKSSLLSYLKHPDTRREHLTIPEQYIFVYMDLQQHHTNSPKDFFSAVFDEIIREFQGNIAINVEPDYKGFKDLVEELEKNDLILIFLFDEFEVITRNENFSYEFFSFLRSIANGYRVSYITASGRYLREMCRSKEISDSPFFNIFTNLFLGPLELNEAKELIITPSSRSRIPLDHRTNLILEMAGRLPFYIQVACSVHFDLLMNPEEHSEKVFIGVVERDFLEEVISHFDYMLDNLTEQELKVVQLVAVEELIPKKFDAIIRDLVRRGVIVKTVDRLCLFSYLFENHILRRYKLKHKAKDRRIMGLPR